MTFICPDCQQDTLEITASIALPADSRSDEIALQTVACSQCGLQAIAVYEESRRGSFETEAWDHSGYRCAKADFELLALDIQRCPDPSRPRCQCPVHRRLGKTDENGYWRAPEAIHNKNTFHMFLA